MRPLSFLAYDYRSVRSYDRDGRLRVARANISKANVNGYAGREIPCGGLDPNRIYRMWRAPEELAAAASTFNSIPILARHIPVTADDHAPDDVVGATGSDARFEAPYLVASLIIWAADAIREIESGRQRELSAAYRYDPVMGAGCTPDGQPYDGVMRGLIANHLALVAEGRAGPDVVVGDERVLSDEAQLYRRQFPELVRIRIL